MQGKKFGRSSRHRRKQRLSYSCSSPYKGNSFLTIRSRLRYLVYFLCATQVNYNAQVSEALANVEEMNKVIRLGMLARQKIN